MEPILHLNEFFVEGGDQKKSHVLLHITEPSTPEEKNKGYFFAICETNNADNESIMKLQSIIDKMENGYYEAKDGENSENFEKILEKINTDNNLLSADDQDLHCVMGIIRPPEIIFSFYNQPQILVFFKKKDGTYNKMDLVEANQDEGTGRSRIFSQIIQGKISLSDYFFIGTPHVADYFSHDRLQKIISSRPPRQGAEHLEKVLSELRNSLSFGGLIVHLGPPEGPVTPYKKYTQEEGDTEKINPLFVTEKNTANTLSPSIAGRMGDKLKNWQTNLSAKPSVKTNNYHGRTEVVSTHIKNRPLKQNDDWDIKNTLGAVWAVIKYIGRLILWILLAITEILKIITKSLVGFFYVITNFRNRRREVLNNISRGWHNYKQNFKQLPKITKFLIVACLLVALFIIGAIYFLNTKKQRVAEEKNFINNLQFIISKKDAADSNLIYNNTTKAFEEIKIAQEYFSKLPCDKKENISTCQDIEDQIETILLKVQKMISVEPQLVSDWSAVSNLNQITKIGSKIIGSGNNQNTAIYDSLTKESKIIDTGYPNIQIIAGATPKENDYAVFLTKDNQLLQFNNQDNTFTKIEVSYPNPTVNIKSIIVYSRRLYSLDILNSQIYRHDSIKTGFGIGREWLREPVDIKNSADLAIEGDLFVLKETGEILRFSSGNVLSFDTQGLDPELKNGGKIWTYNDLQYIYILDPLEKRVVILEKDGKLKAQITAKIFIKPEGMIIDEPNKTGYILDDNKLYQIPLP